MNLWGKIINVLTFGRLKEYLVDPLGRIATSSVLYMFVIGGCSRLIPHYSINSLLGSLLYLALYRALAGDYTNANHYSETLRLDYGQVPAYGQVLNKLRLLHLGTAVVACVTCPVPYVSPFVLFASPIVISVACAYLYTDIPLYYWWLLDDDPLENQPLGHSLTDRHSG